MRYSLRGRSTGRNYEKYYQEAFVDQALIMGGISHISFLFEKMVPINRCEETESDRVVVKNILQQAFCFVEVLVSNVEKPRMGVFVFRVSR